MLGKELSSPRHMLLDTFQDESLVDGLHGIFVHLSPASVNGLCASGQNYHFAVDGLSTILLAKNQQTLSE